MNERVSYIKDTDIIYEDGSHTIFLNSRYTESNAGPAIKEYPDYIRTNDDAGGYTTELLRRTVKKVREVRSDEKMEVSYMMWELKYQDAMAECRAEGRAEGITERALSDLKNLMKNTGWPLEKAMGVLGISESEQKMYLKLLTE